MSTAPAETTEPNAETEAPSETPTPTPGPPKPEERPETFDRDYVERLRAEAAENRTKARDAEAQAATESQAKIDAILKAAGIKTGDDEDPVKAAEAQAKENETRAETAETERDQARRELAIYKSAGEEGADTTALLDSTSFLNTVKEIPYDDAEAIQKAIKKALDDNPRFRSAQGAGQSGGDFTGGTGERQIDQAAFDAMSGTEKNELIKTNPSLYRQLSGR